MGCVTPYGEGCETLWENLVQEKCALQKTDLFSDTSLPITLAAQVPPINARRIVRQYRRTMSPMSVFACLAAEEALEMAHFSRENHPRIGVAMGSTMGSPWETEAFFTEYGKNHSFDSIRSTSFFKTMSHSVAANVAMYCLCEGRLLAPSAACASALLSIGLGYESILLGKENIMLCGGADEVHMFTAATFDHMGAASHAENAERASLPFDANRDGLLVGEGAGVLLLEERESALQRGVPILAEIVGFGSRTSYRNIAQPSCEDMRACMEEALFQAKIDAAAIDYVNAHATATIQGDIAEGEAIGELFGNKTAVSSLKGLLGHTLAASGAIELIAAIRMLKENLLLRNATLNCLDTRCGSINALQENLSLPIMYILKNAFAMGGIYTSLIIKKYTD